ncbi:DUF2203 domain-containing protein [Alkalicoccus saliphilus]|jgi:hypothetical protein|uniref:DUF2203 domain-containing protein n=1 Tax=Alkalicoccus saliphilus TaxID=200989 RepID=A0A2T4U812_9BACI|nr:DUF2203 domain-containing protein [Alkalicoccus saliphilus]PTL39526.1 DUF2203 domain-containing protein [Alkalicoccus saliphilus]
MAKKYFTAEQANRLLPLVKEEIQELKQIQKSFEEKWKLHRKLKEGHQNVQTETKSLFTLECELEFMEIQAQLHVNNIQSTGAVLKGIEPALVDFPSFKGREEVYLCWREGEEEISFYHGLQDGYGGRKPL